MVEVDGNTPAVGRIRGMADGCLEEGGEGSRVPRTCHFPLEVVGDGGRKMDMCPRVHHRGHDRGERRGKLRDACVEDNPGDEMGACRSRADAPGAFLVKACPGHLCHCRTVQQNAPGMGRKVVFLRKAPGLLRDGG